jgi:hypothetical protein
VNGKYRIDAKSPGNAGGRNARFALNFTYTLTDAATKKVLWQRKQPMKRYKGDSSSYPAEGSPVEVYVSDDGYVAANLEDDRLLLVSPEGKDIGVAEILTAFPKAQQQQFVSMTTAGPMWEHDSEWYFVSVKPESEKRGADAGLYFVVRPYWNHRLIVDVKTGKHVDLGERHHAASESDIERAPEAARGLLRAVIAAERRHALAVLAESAIRIKDVNDYKSARRFGAACHTVVHLRIAEAETALRETEKTLVEVAVRRDNLMRRLREALRAIGKVPELRRGQNAWINVRGEVIDQQSVLTVPMSTEDRARHAGMIEVDMDFVRVLDLLGLPDAIIYSAERSYDFDIDATPGYTLRVEVDPNRHTVTKVRTITPYAFFGDPDRLKGW